LSAPHTATTQSSTAALPVLVAAGLIGGGVALALPSLELTVAGVAAGARTIAATLEQSRTFASTGVREFAANYRAGVEHVRGLKLNDPHVLGETLGRQAWTSTEEVVRSTITGATLGASAWAAQHLCAALADAIEHHGPHDAQR